MMRPGLTAAGDRIRVPVGEQLLTPLVDALAIAYTDDPATVSRLLQLHARRVLALDFAMCSETVPEWERSMRAAEADGSREALLGEVPDDVRTDPLLTSDDAITLATRLTKLAGFIRRTTNRTTRP